MWILPFVFSSFLKSRHHRRSPTRHKRNGLGKQSPHRRCLHAVAKTTGRRLLTLHVVVGEVIGSWSHGDKVYSFLLSKLNLFLSSLNFRWDSWICQRWGCHGDDNHVLGLCHRSCKGWSDDGTRCWKKCGSITTTPTTCGNAYCSEDSSACANHVFNIVFSIAQMLSNLIPQKALVTLGGRVAKGVSKAGEKKVYASICHCQT